MNMAEYIPKVLHKVVPRQKTRNSGRRNAAGCIWVHICLLQQWAEQRDGLREHEVEPFMANPPPQSPL